MRIGRRIGKRGFLLTSFLFVMRNYIKQACSTLPLCYNEYRKNKRKGHLFLACKTEESYEKIFFGI